MSLYDQWKTASPYDDEEPLSEDEELFYGMYETIMREGILQSPRGLKTIELLGFRQVFPPYCRFINFTVRKLSLDYIKTEWKWYLGGDLKDLSICNHAKIWNDCVTGGKLYSNYGFYWFKRSINIDRIIQQLNQDQDSRQAVLTIHNTDEHSFEGNRDVPCTLACTFLVRDGCLRLHVHMRSQDAVYGLGNDLPAFSFLQEMIAIILGIPMGELVLMVDSFHIYERHFDMVNSILENPDFIEINAPKMTENDIESGFKKGLFSEWLNETSR